MLNWLRGVISAPERKQSVARALIAWQDLGEPAWSRRDYAAFARDGYARNPVVFRCVRLIAEAAASVPLEARRAGREADPSDPVAALLARPNPEQSGPALFESFFGFLQVAGNAYLEAASLEGRPRELYVLRPDRMSVVAGPQGWPAGWDYKVGGKAVRFARDAASGRSPILHMKVFNPADDHYGLSPLDAAAFAVDTHTAGGRWNKALLDNSARPSGALVYQGAGGSDRLTEEQYERLKAELADIHQGPGAAGRPLLLEGGLEWRPFGLSPSDMDFVQAKNVAAREIALAFGVPPMLLGIPGDNTYSNYKEANLAFWRQTVLPLTRKTARALEGWLRAWLGEDLEIRCREDDVPALAEERAAQWRSLDETAFLTRTEKRQRAGLPAEAAE